MVIGNKHPNIIYGSTIMEMRAFIVEGIKKGSSPFIATNGIIIVNNFTLNCE